MDWQKQAEALKGMVPEDLIASLTQMTVPANIGFEMGQIREGKGGQWDIYYSFEGIATPGQRILLSGLSAAEVEHQEKANEMNLAFGLDIDDPKDQKELHLIERLGKMTPEELDAEIAAAEKFLRET